MQITLYPINNFEQKWIIFYCLLLNYSSYVNISIQNCTWARRRTVSALVLIFVSKFLRKKTKILSSINKLNIQINELCSWKKCGLITPHSSFKKLSLFQCPPFVAASTEKGLGQEMDIFVKVYRGYKLYQNFLCMCKWFLYFCPAC